MKRAEETKKKRDRDVDPNSRFWHHGWKWNSAKRLHQWLKHGRSKSEEDLQSRKKCKMTDNPTFRVNLIAEGSQRFKRRKKKRDI